MVINHIERSLYTPGYPALVKHRPTILASWWCTGFSLAIILVRLCGRLVRMEKLFPEDRIMAASIIPLLGRMALVHVVLLYGTNNLGIVGHTDISTTEDRLITGSKLVLAARVLYAMFLWIQKVAILQSFKQLTGQFWKKGYEFGLVLIRWFLVATFLAIVIATIGECRPISHYWQVQPDPGPQCREAFAQVITMGTLNIITDLILIVFPISIILVSRFNTKRKIQLTLLFALSFLPIAATGYRVPRIVQNKGRQQYRSLWASLEILAATAAANAVVIGSFVRDRGPKKAKYKLGSASGSLERPPTNRRRLSQWGSDEDLFGGTGVGLSPDLRKLPDPEMRPAPVAVAHDQETQCVLNPHYAGFDDDATSSETDLKAMTEVSVSPGQSNKTGFFDVSGLLEEGPPPRYPAPAHATNSKERAAGPNRRGSEALLHDIGGLLTPISEKPRQPSLTPKPAPAALAPPTHPHYASSSHSRPRSSKGATEADSSSQPAPPRSIPAETTNEQRPPSAQRSTTEQSLQDVGGLLK